MAISSGIDEKQLLLRLREGDVRAFDSLMGAYKRPMAQRIWRVLKSKEDTEEILQELFVRLWIHRDKIDPDQSLKAYLFRIATNLVTDMLRKASREKRFASLILYARQQEEAYSPIEEQLFREENRALLYRILQQVPEHSRRVFILCKLEGYSYEETAKQLSISVATVNSHITKANKFLKEYLKNHSHTWIFLLIGYVLYGI